MQSGPLNASRPFSGTGACASCRAVPLISDSWWSIGDSNPGQPLPARQGQACRLLLQALGRATAEERAHGPLGSCSYRAAGPANPGVTKAATSHLLPCADNVLRTRSTVALP